MLIGQTVSSLRTPSLREATLFGGHRAEWERVFDYAASCRQDDAVSRVLEQEARREEQRRERERKLLWTMPAPSCESVSRPHIFAVCMRATWAAYRVRRMPGLMRLTSSWTEVRANFDPGSITSI